MRAGDLVSNLSVFNLQHHLRTRSFPIRFALNFSFF
jgi:hypothetical protein